MFRISDFNLIFDLLNISYIKVKFMKKLLLFATVLGFITISYTARSQDEKEKSKIKDKKESQEIIIRKKGDKDAKITVEINGDKVTINGKPLSDFKDDNVTINKKNITVWDRKGNKDITIAGTDYLDGLPLWNDAENEETYTFLGVTTEEVEGGAKINNVSKESAAEKAGLKEDDVITRIGDKKIDGPESLSDAVRSYKPKDEVTVHYKRDGRENTAKAILGEKKGSSALAYTFRSPGIGSYSYTIPRMPDMSRLRDLENDKIHFYGDMFPRHQKLGLKIQDTEDGTGVKVLSVDKDSPAEKAGLKKDDVLTEVGGTKVTNTDEARDQLQENMDKAAYSIKAKRNGSEMNFDIKFPKKLKTANL